MCHPSVATVGRLISAAALIVMSLCQAAAAAPLACYKKGVQSRESEQKLPLKINNTSSVPALITWIDFEGKQKPYFFLQPGASQAQDTYATHAWIAVSTTNDCMCGHVAEPGPSGTDEWTIAAFEPTASYRQQTLSGFNVKVSSRLIADAALYDKSVSHVGRMLDDMAARLPTEIVAALRTTTTLWIEHSDCRSPAGTYHPSIWWLTANGFNPDKAKGVQFAADHLHWSEQQPAMTLHEIAHAYHDRFLRFDNPDVLKAFAQACRRKKYEMVDYVLGGKRHAYALNNQMEFFAELSEAYFWRNDFEPFDRDGLAAFDPASMQMIERMWHLPVGPPQTGQTGGPLTCADVTAAEK